MGHFGHLWHFGCTLDWDETLGTSRSDPLINEGRANQEPAHSISRNLQIENILLGLNSSELPGA